MFIKNCQLLVDIASVVDKKASKLSDFSTFISFSENNPG